ncbi:hypothetical protein [Psychromonas sp. GE-S-Ul-11]|uniref:hypothetical protein n=1 Tax=Psychromonas sp. GE-S-Ul-11 TaxID=3241170 RepID=UPI00390C948D
MKILVFGDSHSQLLKLSDEMKEIYPSFKKIACEVVSLSGATISGFGKRKSSLNSREVFIRKVNQFKPDVLCFALGQVDVELGYYYKKVVKGDDIDFHTFASELVETYINNTITLVSELGIDVNNVIFKGINLSVLTNSRVKAVNYTSRIITENITDSASILEYKKKLNAAFPSNLERSYYHLKFNKALQDTAVTSGMKYFDINYLVEDKDNKGLVDLKYIPAGQDHHLVDSLYIRSLHIKQLLHGMLPL